MIADHGCDMADGMFFGTGSPVKGQWTKYEFNGPGTFGYMHIDTLIFKTRSAIKTRNGERVIYSLKAADLIFTSDEGWSVKLWDALGKDKGLKGNEAYIILKSRICPFLLSDGIIMTRIPQNPMFKKAKVLTSYKDNILPDTVGIKLERLMDKIASGNPFRMSSKRLANFMARRNRPTVEELEEKKMETLLDVLTERHGAREAQRMIYQMKLTKQKKKRMNG